MYVILTYLFTVMSGAVRRALRVAKDINFILRGIYIALFLRNLFPWLGSITTFISSLTSLLTRYLKIGLKLFLELYINYLRSLLPFFPPVVVIVWVVLSI